MKWYKLATYILATIATKSGSKHNNHINRMYREWLNSISMLWDCNDPRNLKDHENIYTTKYTKKY